MVKQLKCIKEGGGGGRRGKIKKEEIIEIINKEKPRKNLILKK